ncbi:hypothetical protein N7462_001959 [Penicillium macrosclerotiorum]|uniref:uncharacterized protein n=1 Tax=Penicillium macrosclerotiorum TaxID=303699 RepID=UPI002549B245|nr:uncharacterized protein N7462_001959 [Penicillium macrosclerotiorum]KAJ5692536.1 hypothetical protein N7462_001959 [Penicillium macrosclerotiorum]
MHLLVLGATGRTGVYGYKYALEQGYSVTVLVRKADAIEPQHRLTIVEGSCLSEADMQRAFEASGTRVDGVLIFLNAQRVGQNPWGTFIGPPRLVADSTSIAARVLRSQKPKADEHRPRLVVMNALGSGESYAVTPYIIRFMINYSNVSKSYEDHNAVSDEIEKNCGDEISWTLPLPVGLRGQGQKPVKTFASTESGAGFLITRESCAQWMVDVASGKEDDKFSNKRVILSN